MSRIAARFVIGVISGMLLLAALAPVSEVAYGKGARLSKNQMARNRAYRDKLYERIKELAKSQKQIGVVLQTIDEQIEGKDAEIQRIQHELNQASQDQVDLEAERDEIRNSLYSAQANLARRARALYMQDDLTYIDVLFQAASVNDLIDRVIYLRAMHRRDKQMIEATRQKDADLREKVTQLDEQIKAIAVIKQSLLKQQDQLEQVRNDKQLDMEAIKNDKALAQRQIDELEDENKRIAAQLRSIGKSASGYKGKAWSGSFKKPCAGTITSGFGYRFHPILHVNKMHTGVDISAAGGTTINSAGDGKVIYAGWRGGYGKCVIIDHGNNRSTLYGHMSRITCDAGDIVSTSTKIGEVGTTGFSTGNHCHFEVRINGDPVDPLKSLD